MGVYGWDSGFGKLVFNATRAVSLPVVRISDGISVALNLLGQAGWFAQCRYGKLWMSSCLLMFIGIKSLLWIKLLPLGLPLQWPQNFSIHIAQMIKTSRLIVKQFSIARNTQLVSSQSYIEKKEGGGNRGNQEEKRGRVKRGRDQSSQ